MFAFLALILALALAIALAPFILGAIATMLGLVFTFILWAIAGFPDPPAAAKRSPSEQAAFEAPMRQLEEWAEEDEVRALQQKAEKAQKRASEAVRAHALRGARRAEKALLDAQARDPESHGDSGHAQP